MCTSTLCKHAKESMYCTTHITSFSLLIQKYSNIAHLSSYSKLLYFSITTDPDISIFTFLPNNLAVYVVKGLTLGHGEVFGWSSGSKNCLEWPEFLSTKSGPKLSKIVSTLRRTVTRHFKEFLTLCCSRSMINGAGFRVLPLCTCKAKKAFPKASVVVTSKFPR